MLDIYQLLQRQALPLESKIRLSMMRVRAWYTYWEGDLQWSLGSTVPDRALRHLVLNDCRLDVRDIIPGIEPRNLMSSALVEEDPLRINRWLTHGCNAYDTDPPVCSPLSVWSRGDVEKYVKIFEAS